MSRLPTLTDEEIVRRSRALFIERGYEVRTKQIAAAVGLTWGAIALRFGNKWELFNQAMTRPRFEPMCSANEPESAAGLFDLLEQLHAHLSVWWPQSLRFCLATRTMDTYEETNDLLDTLIAALERHARDGIVRSDIEAGVLARMVLTLMIGDATQRFVAREPEFTRDESYIGAMARLLTGAAASVPALGSACCERKQASI